MGASSRQFLSTNGGAAAPTGLSSPAIHPGLATVIAVHPLEITKITEGGSAGTNAGGEDIHQDVRNLASCERVSCPAGSEAGCLPKQTFIGINVADTSHKA